MSLQWSLRTGSKCCPKRETAHQSTPPVFRTGYLWFDLSPPPRLALVCLFTFVLFGFSGFDLWLQAHLNSLIHALIGNTTTNPRIISLGSSIPANTTRKNESESQEPTFPLNILKLSKEALLELRPSKNPEPLPLNLPVTHPIILSKSRTGRRKCGYTASGSKFYYTCRSKKSSPPRPNLQNSSPQAVKPPPPQRGTPGVASATVEESTPQSPPPSSLLGWGARARGRRFYRQWRRLARENMGNASVRGGDPLTAVNQCRLKGIRNATAFRNLVLKKTTLCSRRQPIQRPQATPQLSYGIRLRIGTQNVQGMMEILKHQSVLQLLKDTQLDLLFLTETHAKSYYAFHSQQNLFIVNGNNKDKWSGVTAVITPHLQPFIKQVIQHTSRILQITLSSSSGDIHLIGVYAPHDKSDVETRKDPFWQKLEHIVSGIPLLRHRRLQRQTPEQKQTGTRSAGTTHIRQRFPSGQYPSPLEPNLLYELSPIRSRGRRPNFQAASTPQAYHISGQTPATSNLGAICTGPPYHASGLG